MMSRVLRMGWLAPLCWLGVRAIDHLLIPWTVTGDPSKNVAQRALLDEPAHLLTNVACVLLLAAVAGLLGRRLPVLFAAGALFAGNAIDADHVPGLLGNDVISAGTPRPYSHSLLSVLLLLVLAAAAAVWQRAGWRDALLGMAFGVSCHLLRDLGTAPVSLLWPVTDRSFQYAWQTYHAVLGALSALAAAAAVAMGLLATAPRGDQPPRRRGLNEATTDSAAPPPPGPARERTRRSR